ncbi:MAG: hypothetical protein HOP17_12850 [Acidobacteria bacterium]|nr:hypothetical protein [Acidobacteriota bacterium]
MHAVNMFEDPIVEEVRRVRDKLAARFDYNIEAIVENARKEQAASGRNTVSLPPRKPGARRLGRLSRRVDREPPIASHYFKDRKGD